MSNTQEIKTMKEDIAEMKDLLAGQMKEATSNGNSAMFMSREELSEMANKAGKSVREFASDKREQIDEAKALTQDTIKARPLTSAAVAMVSGLALGALLSKK